MLSVENIIYVSNNKLFTNLMKLKIGEIHNICKEKSINIYNDKNKKIIKKDLILKIINYYENLN
jgi:hypothetical protein